MELDLFTQYNAMLLVRIGLSIFLGFMLGFEREMTGKFAGLRTHILVCVGACVFTILSIYSFKMQEIVGYAGINDPARIAAQIITGIGFIGAGTVMRHGSNILGITTAATLWICAAVGMACGTGEFILATIATVASVLVLILIRIFEKNVIRKKAKTYKTLEIKLSTGIDNLELINQVIEKNFSRISKIDRKVLNGTDLKLKVNVTASKNLSQINEIFTKLECINSLEIQELYD